MPLTPEHLVVMGLGRYLCPFLPAAMVAATNWVPHDRLMRWIETVFEYLGLVSDAAEKQPALRWRPEVGRLDGTGSQVSGSLYALFMHVVRAEFHLIMLLVIA